MRFHVASFPAAVLTIAVLVGALSAQGVPKTALPAELRIACDTIAALLRSLPSETVKQSVGSVQNPVTHGPVPWCRVEARGDMRALPAGTQPGTALVRNAAGARRRAPAGARGHRARFRHHEAGASRDARSIILAPGGEGHDPDAGAGGLSHEASRSHTAPPFEGARTRALHLAGQPGLLRADRDLARAGYNDQRAPRDRRA